MLQGCDLKSRYAKDMKNNMEARMYAYTRGSNGTRPGEGGRGAWGAIPGADSAPTAAARHCAPPPSAAPPPPPPPPPPPRLAAHPFGGSPGPGLPRAGGGGSAARAGRF